MKISGHILPVLITFLTACGSGNTPVDIKGNAPGLDGVLRLSTGDSVLIAENIKKDGTFNIDGIIDEPGFYVLELFENGKSEKNEFLIYLDNTPVHISFDVSDLKKYPRFSGRLKHQKDISKFYSKLNPAMQGAAMDYERAKKILQSEMEKANGDQAKILIENFRAAEQRKNSIRNDITENYILNNPSSLLSAYLILQATAEIINKPAFYYDLYQNLSADVKNSKYGRKAGSLIKSTLKSDKDPVLP